MKNIELTILQKVIILVILFFSGIFLYYTPNTKKDSQLINYNHKTLHSPKEQQWITVNNLLFMKVEDIYGDWAKNGLFDITYRVPLTIIRQDEIDGVKEVRPSLYDDLPILQLVNHNNARNLRITKDNWQHYIEFDTFVLSKKYITVKVNNADTITIKTNPMVALKDIRSLLFVICTLFVMYFMIKGFGHASIMVLFGVLASALLNTELSIIILLLILFLSVSILRIKLIKVNTISEVLIFNTYYYVSIYILTTIAIAIDNHASFSVDGIVGAMFMGLFFFIFVAVGIFSTLEILHIQYIFLSTPSQTVQEIEIYNVKQFSSKGLRSIPAFSADVYLNNKIRLCNIDIDGITYYKTNKKLKLNITQYKVDKKGNYIFY